MVNVHLIFRRVENLGMTISKCEVCPSQTARRMDMKGLHLRFEGVEDPLNEFNDDTLFTTDHLGRLEFANSLAPRLADLIKEALNLRSTAQKSYEWGRKLPNGTWTGTVLNVFSGTADVGITSSVMLPNRAELIGFLPPTDEHIISAFLKPAPLNAIRDIFMEPFESKLWMVFIITQFALAFSMFIFTIIRQKFGTAETKGFSTKPEPDFRHDSFIWVLATVCQQGWDVHPRAVSLRTIFISGSLSGVIAYAGYSAAIVSTLSLRIDPIKTPEDLLDSNLRIGIRVGFINDVLLKSDTRDIIASIRARLSPRKGEALVNSTVGVKLLHESSYAYICTRENLYDVLKVKESANVHEYICGIKELVILQQGFTVGMFCRKYFPYREHFRLMLIKIRERGVLWRLRNEFSYERRCLEAKDNKGQALEAKDVFTAFMILICGCLLSFIILGFELLRPQVHKYIE